MGLVLFNGKFLLQDGKPIIGDTSCCCSTTSTTNVPCYTIILYEGMIGTWGPDVIGCMCPDMWENLWNGAAAQVQKYVDCYQGGIDSVLEFYTKAGYEIVTVGGAGANTEVPECQKYMGENNIQCPIAEDSGECDTSNEAGKIVVCDDCVSCAPYAEGQIIVKCCKSKNANKEFDLVQNEDGLFHYIDNMNLVSFCDGDGPLPSVKIDDSFYPDVRIPLCQ